VKRSLSSHRLPAPGSLAEAVATSSGRGVFITRPDGQGVAPSRHALLRALASSLLVIAAPAVVRGSALMGVRTVPPLASRRGLNFASALFLHWRDNAIAKLQAEGCPPGQIERELFARGVVMNRPYAEP